MVIEKTSDFSRGLINERLEGAFFMVITEFSEWTQIGGRRRMTYNSERLSILFTFKKASSTLCHSKEHDMCDREAHVVGLVLLLPTLKLIP